MTKEVYGDDDTVITNLDFRELDNGERIETFIYDYGCIITIQKAE